MENVIQKCRFEFVLKMNGNIVCQRYFKIKGIKSKKLHTMKIYDAMWDCVELINKDLNFKAHEYISRTAPITVRSKNTINQKLTIGDYLYGQEEGKYYIWDGAMLIPIGERDPTLRWMSPRERPEVILSFTFIDNGPEEGKQMPNPVTVCWDASLYPKPIISRIDITNKKPLFPWMEGDRESLIPQIIKTLSNACRNKVTPKNNYKQNNNLMYE